MKTKQISFTYPLEKEGITLEVNFELFQVQCDKFKNSLNRKIDRAMNTYLEAIAEFCTKEVAEIHNATSNIETTIKKIPTKYFSLL